jgi:capsular polysaccharide transport system ATP-binding protein
MIVFDRVSKAYRSPRTTKVILEEAHFVFKRGQSVGILGLNGAGKSTLLRMIAGTEMPDSGRITRGSRVSFPLGFSGGFNGSMTGRENCRFAARIYGADHRKVEAYVHDFSELADYFDEPFKTYSSGMRARLAFGLSMAISFDVYLIDEITAVGDAPFQKRCAEVFAERRKSADVIMVSHSPATISAYCDQAAILGNGRLEFFTSISEASAAYKIRTGASGDKQSQTAPTVERQA